MIVRLDLDLDLRANKIEAGEAKQRRQTCISERRRKAGLVNNFLAIQFHSNLRNFIDLDLEGNELRSRANFVHPPS